MNQSSIDVELPLMKIISNPPVCPGSDREAVAVEIEILYKLMGVKLGNGLTEKWNHCHHFQLICLDLCLGAGNTVMAVIEQGENHSLSVPVTFCWHTVTQFGLAGETSQSRIHNLVYANVEKCRPIFQYCQRLRVINKLFTRQPARTFIMKQTLLPHNYSIVMKKARKAENMPAVPHSIQLDH